jgi:RNA polymerase sigma-70 factor, ECF subfamily
MSPNSDSGPTELLRAWSQGDRSALDRLIPLVYEELHRLARRYMRQERPDHTLQATSLVNEAYLRLIDVNRVEWRNRAHFFAVAAQMMRRILVESARSRQRQKRGGGGVHVNLDDLQELPDLKEHDLVALNDALSGLATFDARMSQVVELRFFGGLTVEETADVLKISPETVMRDWKTARPGSSARSSKVTGLFRARSHHDAGQARDERFDRLVRLGRLACGHAALSAKASGETSRLKPTGSSDAELPARALATRGRSGEPRGHGLGLREPRTSFLVTGS